MVPGDTRSPDWRRVDIRGALVATASFAALVFALSQAQSAGWASAQTLGVGSAGMAGLVGFAAYERRVALPLLDLGRLGERAVGGGFLMMLAAAAVLFGSFLLSSLYLQDVLGTSALKTGLAFLPFALVIGAGVHVGTHVINRHGVRIPLAAGFAITAAGMFLLTGVTTRGSYLSDLLPGMLIAGVGLGIVLVSVAVSVLAGAREEDSGMLSGLNTTGHEIGGSIGLAVLATIATSGLGRSSGAGAASVLANGLSDAFLAAGIIAAAASFAALLILPAAKAFLPKLALARPASIH
jgi:hypothetical protein